MSDDNEHLANGHDDQTPSDSRRENVLGIPLAGWAIVAVSLIFVLYVAGHYGFQLYDDWQRAKADKAKLASEIEKSDAINRDTSIYTNAITKEIDAHRHDHSGHQFVLHTDSSGIIMATYFDSDGCVALARPGPPLPYLPPQSILDWSLGPEKRPTTSPPSAVMPTMNKSPVSVTIPNRKPKLQRVGQSLPETTHVQAGCWTNGVHPWPFRSWWGPANGCWAPLYRQWNDSCTHYQMFNTCNGQWDPRIFWTFCNPNHHP
ncbi:MAG TPA: hypothetical protein VHB45_07595 [Alloacidobacterium sp.]|nr:hypothetical protein [Alloacidobacterium sp.]